MDGTAFSLPAAAALGLVYGVGACALACLPYLAPVLAATGDGPRTAWRRMVPFTAGRVAGYAALGGFSAAAGGALTAHLGTWPNWLIGGAALLLGVYLFRTAGRPGGPAPCSKKGRYSQPKAFPTVQAGPTTSAATNAALPGGLFALGAGMALNPLCASLGLVLAAAAVTGNPVAGALLGSAFGLGTSVGPFLLYGVVFAQLGAALHGWLHQRRQTLQRGAALLLAAFGIAAAIL